MSPVSPQQPSAVPAFVSTGSLPARQEVLALVETAYAKFRNERAGQVADYIPALAEADAASFGICVANTRGETFALGDAELPFSIQSVSKPFAFALVCDALGAEEAANRLGVDATGLPFNSIMAVELRADRSTNPLVNSGAMRSNALADLVCSDPSTISRQTASLVEHGFIERRPDPDDGRAVQLAATAKGFATFRQMREERDAMLASVLADWDPADVQTFTHLLDRFTTDLEHHRPRLLKTFDALENS